MDKVILNKFSSYLITYFDKKSPASNDKTISVDPVVAEVASFYEKIRTAMDYREEEVILRAAIERIIKRRLILGGSGKTIAEPLVRELAWARYFPDNSVPETFVDRVEEIIDLHFKLQDKISKLHKINRNTLFIWILQFVSSEIAYVLSPIKDKETISNYIFQIYKDQVQISDDEEETKDAQVFIAIRRTYNKEDSALLRYNLFVQLFGHLSNENLDYTAENFLKGIKKIETQLDYPLKDKIYTYIKKRIIPFFILEDILKKHRGENRQLISDEEAFRKEIINTCTEKYENIKAKVGRAIIRGVIFILLTKALFGLVVEGTFENLIYGAVSWGSIALNTLFPPVMMIIVGLMIKTPGKENSGKILDRIKDIFYQSPDEFNRKLITKKTSSKRDPLMNGIFIILWLLALVLGVSSTLFVLDKINLNFVSQGVFIFFLTIVLFISFRINQTAHMYTMEDEKRNVTSVLFDFLFMPLIHLGRDLTENISKINVFLIVFDHLIETPFKVIFGFFEQWFLYLRSQREKLG